VLSEQQEETMQCAVQKDKHEQTETKTVISIFNLKKKRNCGFGMKKTENRTDFKISKPLHH